jgi:predicted acylesterase/phospholipase RssA
MVPLHARTTQHRQNEVAKSASNAAQADPTAKTALIIGGGAPNSALMAGALAAFEEKGIRFDVVSTSGAGGLVGLLWLAPKDKTPAQALKDWVGSYVADPIYAMLPVDYKVFYKPGPMADAWRGWLNSFPGVQAVTDQSRQDGIQRLWSDWMQLLWATASPSSLTSFDVGLCARVPWAESLIDFDRVKDITPFFYLNAYNVTNKIIDDFPKEQITLDHFRAAFAFPFIYGPYEVDGCEYYEGASRDCLNFKDVVEKHPGLETIVVFDVLGVDSLIRKPRNLYDSWVLSMIIPLVKVAEDNLILFALQYNNGWRRAEGAKADLLVVQFDVPEAHMDEVLDWSHSNGQRLFDTGYRSALEFLAGEGAVLET